MSLQGLGTFKPGASDTALRIQVSGEECTLTHARLNAYRFEQGIVAEIKAQAREHGITLPDLHVHINRDGTLALATGPALLEWPEGLVMVRQVDEINVTNWTVTGVEVKIPQYRFDLEVKWTDNDGNPHTHTGNYRYPNDIGDMPLNVRRKYAEEMVIATVRVALGINEWSDYG